MSFAGARNSSGAVLIDILTSMVFVLLLIGMAQTWMRAVLYAQKTIETVATAGQEAAVAVDAIARDLRDAGFDTGVAVAPILAAGVDFLELAADFNGDGDTLDAHEHIRYAYRADRRQLTRASGRGSPQPFADDVPAGGLQMSFFDADAVAIPVGPAGIEAGDLARIRGVDIRLVLEPAHPDPRATTLIRGKAAIAVALRNR